MRYRIITKILESGRIEYIPQVKKIIGWGFVKEKDYIKTVKESALKAIDKHHLRYLNKTKKSVEIEYIDK